MKKHFLIVVEGPHDSGIIGNLVHFRKYARKTDKREKVSGVWNGIIPRSYPFSIDKYDRVSPVPDFYESADLSLAIKTAGGDSSFGEVLKSLLAVLDFKDQKQIAGILIVTDADDKLAADKKSKIIKEITDTEGIDYESGNISVTGAPVSIPVTFYCFPDDNGMGNLENLLLEIGDVQYPLLLEGAKDYIDTAAKTGYSELDLKSSSKFNKAIIGCVTNTMKPGKANQMSIFENKWITDEALDKVEALKKLDETLERFLRS